MEAGRLKTLKALAKSFARTTKDGEKIKEGPWSADFVKGKGNGLIFLLHGKPGMGKTCTAGELIPSQFPSPVLQGPGYNTNSCPYIRVHRRVHATPFDGTDKQ